MRSTTKTVMAAIGGKRKVFFGVRKLLEDGFRLSNFGGLGGIQVLRNAFV